LEEALLLLQSFDLNQHLLVNNFKSLCYFTLTWLLNWKF